MVNLVINLDKINKFSKIKHSIIVITLITILFITPYFLEYIPSYAPYRSINSQADYGHSNLANNLTLDYQIDSLTGSLSDIGSMTARDSILVIIAPENRYKLDDLELLDRWLDRGGSILIIGTTSQTIELGAHYYYSYNEFSGKIYDRTNNFNDPGTPLVYGPNGDQYYAVVPLSVDYLGVNSSFTDKIQTANSAEDKYCIVNNQQCLGYSYTIGFTHRSTKALEGSQVSLVADNWMFSNYYTNLIPENIELFHDIIKKMNLNTKQIIFEETHYNYAPVNKIAIENILNKVFTSSVVNILLILFAIIFPLGLGTYGGIFSNITKVLFSNKIGRRLGERLESLHLENVTAVVMTKEEKFLVDMQLSMQRRGKHFFKLIALEMRKYIEEEDLKIAADTLEDLMTMEEYIIQPDHCWRLILRVNEEIELAEIAKEKDKLGGNIL